MNKEEIELLNGIPENVDYTDVARDLDEGDIPSERLNKVTVLLESVDLEIRYSAAILLTHWGNEKGFKILRILVLSNSSSITTHRLRGYDDSLEHALSAFLAYWAKQTDRGEEARAKLKIFEPMKKIIDESNKHPFEINLIYPWLERKHYKEYIPLIKNHIKEIIEKPELHHYKVQDAIVFLQKIEPIFVTEVFKKARGISRGCPHFSLPKNNVVI